jgi:hypothetical protein
VDAQFENPECRVLCQIAIRRLFPDSEHIQSLDNDRPMRSRVLGGGDPWIAPCVVNGAGYRFES